MFGYPHLTLKEGSKVKSDHINRFPAHDFLQVGYNDLLNSESLKEAIAQLCHDRGLQFHYVIADQNVCE